MSGIEKPVKGYHGCKSCIGSDLGDYHGELCHPEIHSEPASNSSGEVKPPNDFIAELHADGPAEGGQDDCIEYCIMGYLR